MGDLHRLPDTSHDDRRLIDVTLEELRLLIADEVERAIGGREGDDEKPVSAKAAAKALGTGEQRVRDWCKHGCDACGEKMPSMMVSDERGLKVYLSRAREWMEHHLSPEGCRG